MEALRRLAATVRTAGQVLHSVAIRSMGALVVLLWVPAFCHPDAGGTVRGTRPTTNAALVGMHCPRLHLQACAEHDSRLTITVAVDVSAATTTPSVAMRCLKEALRDTSNLSHPAMCTDVVCYASACS